MSAAERTLSPEKDERIPPRERILAVAADLFYRHGIRAVGVEAIAEAAGTNKMTLYRHFASKDELVAEYLRQSGRRGRCLSGTDSKPTIRAIRGAVARLAEGNGRPTWPAPTSAAARWPMRPLNCRKRIIRPGG